MLKKGRMLLVAGCLVLAAACGGEEAATATPTAAPPPPVAAPVAPPPRPMAQQAAPEEPPRNEVTDEQLMNAMQTYEAKLLQENMTNMIKNNPSVQPTAEQQESCSAKMVPCNCPEQAIQACGIMVALLDAKLVETGHEAKGRWTYVDQMECIDACIGRYSNKLQQEYRAMTLKYH